MLLTTGVQSVFAAPPQLLWHRDIPNVFLDLNGLEISGNGQTIVVVSTGWEPSTLYVLNGTNGEILWTLNYDDITRTFIRASISDDGQIIAIGDGLYPYNAYWGLEDISQEYGPYQTQIFNRDGTIRTTIPGGMGMLTPDGTKVYIYGIWYDVQPENDIWKFKHGLFDTRGLELWSHTIEPVATINENLKGISTDGSTILRECSFRVNGIRPTNCRDWYSSFIVLDGQNGDILFTNRRGSNFVSLSRNGKYIGTEYRDPYTRRIYCRILSRTGNAIMSFESATQVLAVTLSPQENKVMCLSLTNLYWLDLQGNLLWSLPCSECWPGAIQISSDNRVLLIVYRTPETSSYRTNIIDTRSGTVVYTFNDAAGKMTLDGSKVLITDESSFVELWDITPLFSGEKKTKGERCKADRETG